ncbi:TMV resistance protein N-like [Bidens hawaiensis]|uniref:TMV resistance protein N-like n=1 Tax=Bidens hawaiensis TaxID=980011 RepID=UPI00404AA98B
MRMMLWNKKVLIVLDDIIDFDQMEALVGSCGSFGKGSRIIVASRDSQFPSNKVDMFYNVTLLSHEEAVQLFERHAYGGHKLVDKSTWRPSGSLVEAYHTQDAISYSNRLPLALKVLGSFLYKKEMIYGSVLVQLKYTPKLGIMDKLKISYDGLQNSEKELLLDIACFFLGKLVDSPMMLLLESNS